VPRRNTDFRSVPRLAERIEDARKNAGYSLRGIAKELGISQSGYANYELGKAEPSLSVFIRMSELFHVSIDDLLGTSEVKNPGGNQRQQTLNELWLIIESLHNRQGYNSLQERSAVYESISLFKEILKSNTLTKMPDEDKNLATLVGSFEEINAIYSGKKIHPKQSSRIDADIFLPYRNIKLLCDMLKIFLEFLKSREYEFENKDDYCSKLLQLKNEFRLIEDEFEKMFILNANVKGEE